MDTLLIYKKINDLVALGSQLGLSTKVENTCVLFKWGRKICFKIFLSEKHLIESGLKNGFVYLLENELPIEQPYMTKQKIVETWYKCDVNHWGMDDDWFMFAKISFNPQDTLTPKERDFLVNLNIKLQKEYEKQMQRVERLEKLSSELIELKKQLDGPLSEEDRAQIQERYDQIVAKPSPTAPIIKIKSLTNKTIDI